MSHQPQILFLSQKRIYNHEWWNSLGYPIMWCVAPMSMIHSKWLHFPLWAAKAWSVPTSSVDPSLWRPLRYAWRLSVACLLFLFYCICIYIRWTSHSHHLLFFSSILTYSSTYIFLLMMKFPTKVNTMALQWVQLLFCLVVEVWPLLIRADLSLVFLFLTMINRITNHN